MRRAFNELVHTRVLFLEGRVKSKPVVDPDSAEIIRFVTAARHYRIRAVGVDDWSGDYGPQDVSPDEAWDQERDTRRALVEQVTALLDLPHPPRASLFRHWWRRGKVRVRKAIASTWTSFRRPAIGSTR